MTNWAEYDAALRQRGSLTVWFTDAAIAAWRAAPRTTPGGQPSYSDLAIATALTLRAVFRLALRQTEGRDRREIGGATAVGYFRARSLTEGGCVAWVLRLVEIGAEGEGPCADVVEAA